MNLPSSGGTHPDAMLTAAYLDGTLDGEGVERIERHLARCPRCRESVVALRALPVSDDRVPAEYLARANDRSRARGSTARLMAAAGIAAVLVTAVVVGTLAVRRASAPSGEEPLYRATQPVGLDAIFPSAGARLEGAEVDFRWTPQPDADRYVLSVLSASGTAIATLDVRDGDSTVPWRPEGLSVRPVTLLWKVRAMRGERVVAESRPYAFELR